MIDPLLRLGGIDFEAQSDVAEPHRRVPGNAKSPAEIQIALGQDAPVAEKKSWDPTGAKKESLRAAVADLLPELEVRSGGSTSIDITRKGIDKAYGMRKLAALTGIPIERMLFVGDRLDPGGNDYPVKATGVRTFAVEGWQDTAEFVAGFLGVAKAR